MGRYDQVYRRSLEDPAGFWGEAAAALRWRRKWDRVLDPDNPRHPRWFQGGELNTCENAVDVHVESGRGDQLALVWDSAVTGQTAKYTYRDLQREVALFAGAYFARAGIRHELAVPLPPDGELDRRVMLFRADGPDFTDRDVMLMGLLRRT